MAKSKKQHFLKSEKSSRFLGFSEKRSFLKSQQNVFWEALLVTILIFGIGIILGFILENWRTGKIDNLYQESEVDLLDIRLQNDIYSKGDFSCENAADELVIFADKVYEEAKMLGRYEQASKMADDLILQHKRYDLLRALLWLNSIHVKEKCNASFKQIVYLYEYQSSDLDTKAKQNVFSNVLNEVKQKYGNNILLIPLAGNLGLKSIDLLKSNYNVTELPVIIINGGIKINEIETAKDIEKLLG